MRKRSQSSEPVYELVGMNTPKGPDESPPADPAQLKYEAEQAGASDADHYDKHVFLADAGFGFVRELEARFHQWEAQLKIRESHEQQLNDELLARKRQDLQDAQQAYKDAAEESAAAEAQVGRTRETLLSPSGAFRDPDRLGESWWVTVLTTTWVVVICAVLEVGLNTTVFMIMNASTLETVLMALAVLAAGVLAPHAAGVHARRRRSLETGRIWLVRWGMPVVFAVLLGVVQLFMATLRSSYLSSPETDPTTGETGPSLLSTLGVPPSAVFAGWWALQLVLSLVVAWHAESTHNPYVAAHRRAVSALQRARQRQRSIRLVEAADRVEAAVADRERVQSQYGWKTRELSDCKDQAVEIYGTTMARVKADPEFTEAMDLWLARRAAVGARSLRAV